MKTPRLFLYLSICIAIFLCTASVKAKGLDVGADLSHCEDPTCAWSFGDGNSTTGCGVQDYSYSDPGTYDVTFTMDCGQLEQQVTREVSVGGTNALTSCQDHLQAGHTESGVYEIDPDGEGGKKPFKAYCDQENMGGRLDFGG